MNPSSVSSAPFVINGRTCRIVCEPHQHANEHPPNLVLLATSLVGKWIEDARNAYPHIRVVKQNGYEVPFLSNGDQKHINVETIDDIVSKIVGYY